MSQDSIQQKWVDKKITDDILLAYTDKLKNAKKGKKCLVISGSHVIQHVDYKKFMDSGYETLFLNQGYLLPHAEEMTWCFLGAMGYIGSFVNSSAFKYFCHKFKGEIVFVAHTSHCKHAAYAVCRTDIVRQCVKANNIKRFRLITQSNGLDIRRHGYSFIPPFKSWSPSKVPYGCGGTLNAMAIPFLLQLGYSTIAIAGVGDQDMRHFYDVSYIQPHLHKPYAHKLRPTTLKRWGAWRKIAEANRTKLIVIPDSKIEQSVKNVLVSLPEDKLLNA